MTFPSCVLCEHFHRTDREADTCTAFPKGIPEDIWNGKTDHRERVSGDHGIVFSPSTYLARVAGTAKPEPVLPK